MVNWKELQAKDPAKCHDIVAAVGSGTSDYYRGLLHILEIADSLGERGFTRYFIENLEPYIRGYAQIQLEDTASPSGYNTSDVPSGFVIGKPKRQRKRKGGD